MTEKSSPENRNPLPEGFQTASSERRGARQKTGRVSQRRELAIVTLGAVAAITGLGGVLAANPPSWAASEANARSSVTTQAATTQTQSTQSTSKQNNATHPSSDKEDVPASVRSNPQQDRSGTTQASVQQRAARQAARRTSRRTARQAAQRTVKQSTPVYSAPTQASASAVSQGS